MKKLSSVLRIGLIQTVNYSLQGDSMNTDAQGCLLAAMVTAHRSGFKFIDF